MLFAACGYLNLAKRDLRRFAEFAKIRVVGDHTDDIAVHFPSSESEDEILETMRNFRDEDGDPCSLTGDRGLAGHRQFQPCHARERSGNLADRLFVSQLSP